MGGVDNLLVRYPDRVPVSVDTVGNTYLDKNKYLVPRTMTVGEFNIVIRKRINVKSYEAVFLFCKNTLPSNSMTFDEIYRQHAANDQLLYLTYGKEHTFG